MVKNIQKFYSLAEDLRKGATSRLFETVLSITYQPIIRMHVAYSALKPENTRDQSHTGKRAGDRLLRYTAYLEACEKYRSEIAAIQKYFPKWAPEFR